MVHALLCDLKFYSYTQLVISKFMSYTQLLILHLWYEFVISKFYFVNFIYP